MPRRRDTESLDLFADAQARYEDKQLRHAPPDQRRFPTNLGDYRVAQPVEADLLESASPLLVTGYAALDRFIVFCGQVRAQQVRVLFGHEPFVHGRRSFRLDGQDFPREVEAYWLEQHISLMHSAALIHAIELLEAGRVQARFVGGGRRMHAKIYVGERAASVGSSNFTDPGMSSQYEANARFERAEQPKRYEELQRLAESYWSLGRDYNADLLALLHKLLRFVSWQEALARAAAELLEGEWAADYLRDDYLSDADSLWPSQRQGIAQALAVVSNHDSVLIADATGAGKTRMGAYLIGALRDQITRRGRMRSRANTVMVCPPAVMQNWEREKRAANIDMEVYSHGGLSHQSSHGHELKVEALRRAQILCVDEGHNFLNLATKRTQLLLRNMADHVVMLTATPINRSVTDLLRIADMLGADNLEPSTLKAFDKMLGARRLSRTLSEEETRLLRDEIRKFTVRRTKAMLNTLIERDPDRYRDQGGRRCRFPRHRARVYRLDEPQSDRALALRVRELSSQLHGVTHFERPIELPKGLKRLGVTEDQYLNGRLHGARKLVQYLILSSLRSSRAALIEHIEGTEAAVSAFGLSGFRKKTPGGNILARLAKQAGKLPNNKLSIALPDWLSDARAHRRACEQDAAIYREIAACCRELSDAREKRKAEQLLVNVRHHCLILAFDSRPITLAVIRKLLGKERGFETLMGWGEAERERAELMQRFAPGSDARNVIGLCSDSLSEGVNLQRASALVHLDMPTVVRIAEQRAGRVDRLDTAHEEIEVWWPDDAPEFALAADEKFVQRYETVDSLLGANMPLPEHLRDETPRVRVESMIEEYEQAATQPWDGLDDAFAPARMLISGESALVDAQTYAHYRHVSERVMSRVSLVGAKRPWAFFCITAGAFAAPRWILLPSYNAAAVTELLDVANGLRKRLGPEVVSLSDHEAGAEELQRFIRRLVLVERELLSRKKQRALAEMAWCLKDLRTRAAEQQRQLAVDVLDALIRLLDSPAPDAQPDWDELATRWLDLIRPVWFSQLEAPRRTRPLLLKDLRGALTERADWLEREVMQHFDEIPVMQGLDRRIRACIVGVPGGDSS